VHGDLARRTRASANRATRYSPRIRLGDCRDRCASAVDLVVDWRAYASVVGAFAASMSPLCIRPEMATCCATPTRCAGTSSVRSTQGIRRPDAPQLNERGRRGSARVVAATPRELQGPCLDQRGAASAARTRAATAFRPWRELLSGRRRRPLGEQRFQCHSAHARVESSSSSTMAPIVQDLVRREFVVRLRSTGAGAEHPQPVLVRRGFGQQQHEERARLLGSQRCSRSRSSLFVGPSPADGSRAMPRRSSSYESRPEPGCRARFW
jgi:hypothetical protein